MRRREWICTSGSGLLSLALGRSGVGADGGQRRTQLICGWTLHIQERLWLEDRQRTERAIELLKGQLLEIEQRVPDGAVESLREVALYFSPQYEGERARAEYHPNAAWLRSHDRDPAMAKGVEFSNIAIFEQETNRMPNFALHELAHAYHDRNLEGGFSNQQVKEAFEAARDSGLYEQVARWHGNGRSNTTERAYAMNNPMEYFAESSEAYFGRNDFYPFDRAELARHDPRMHALLGQLWNQYETDAS